MCLIGWINLLRGTIISCLGLRMCFWFHWGYKNDMIFIHLCMIWIMTAMYIFGPTPKWVHYNYVHISNCDALCMKVDWVLMLKISFIVYGNHTNSTYTCDGCAQTTQIHTGYYACFSYWQFYILNPLCAKFFRGNMNIYLHFISLLHIDMTDVLKILSQVRPGPTYST